MKEQVIQWHPGFNAALQIELEAEKGKLQFEEEHLLGKKPMQIDTLVIKVRPEDIIDKNIGRIFRTYNVIEYKGPDDYVSINDFYKVMGYACFFQSDTENVCQIPPEELTITFVCSHYPRKMITHLCERYGMKVERTENGIYYIMGAMFPIQILVVTRLSRESNFWLSRLKRGLDTNLDIEPLAKAYYGKEHNGLYSAVMDLIVRANREKYGEVRDVCDALNELFADKMEELEREAVKRGMKKGTEKGIETLISAYKELNISRESASEMVREKYELSAEEIMLYMEKYW